jgi:hypothetical protein
MRCTRNKGWVACLGGGLGRAVLALALTVLLQFGCTPAMVVSRGKVGRDTDLNQANGRLAKAESPIKREPRAVTVNLVFRGTEARGGFLFEGVDVAKLAEQQCKEWFVCSGDSDHPGRGNYTILNRDFVQEVAQEAAANGGSQLRGADFEIRLAVGLVERQIRSDGSTSEWTLGGYVGGSDSSRERQGALSVSASIIRCSTQVEMYSMTSYGELVETERTQGRHHVMGGSTATVRESTTVPDAIRAATFELARAMDAFFGRYLAEQMAKASAGRNSREGLGLQSDGSEFRGEARSRR